MWSDVKSESKLITILVLFLAVAGLILTYFAVVSITPIELNIGDIKDSMTGRLVKISGSIDNIRKSSSGNSYWTIKDYRNDTDGMGGAGIIVPILDSKFKKIVPKRGDFVEIVGLVTKYKEELEVMPKEIRTDT
jgi:exonuclease VII large subunit